jgi:uncharacterized protein YggE
MVMMRKLFAIVGGLALVTLFTTQQSLAETNGSQITLRGRLQRTVEPGGWLIVADGQKYLLLNAQRFQKESWFKETAEVEATGDTKSDVMTTYMEGSPFEVRSLRPLAQGPAGGGNQAVTGGDTRRLTRVTVSGDSIVQAQPDTAIITVSVVTQSKRAIDAQQENAAKSNAVVRALKAAAGAGAEVKTSGYSLQPQRVYRENQPPTITGYEARNSVTVTLSDLTKVGAVIDGTAQAGANDIAGISFTLRRDRPARDEALAQATQEATGKARVIAQALGGRLVRILEVQEDGTMRPPIPLYEKQMDMRTMAAAQTPIEVGSLEITSRVQLIAEVEGG